MPVVKSAEPTVGDMSEEVTSKKKLVVVGAGMVAQRLVEALDARGATESWDIEVFGEESRTPPNCTSATRTSGSAPGSASIATLRSPASTARQRPSRH